MAVNDLKLRLALEPKDDRIARFPILRDCSVQLRKSLKAGQLIEDKPDRMLFQVSVRSEGAERACRSKGCAEVASASRSAGCDVRKIQPLRSFDHSRAVHSSAASSFRGSSRKLSAMRLREASTPDRCCGAERIDQRSKFRILDPPVDLFRMRHPVD